MSDFELQMRWADLDRQNHVNNVRYVDYALAAIGRLADDGGLGQLQPIARMEVQYLRPLMLTRTPLRISSELSGCHLAQKVWSGATVYAAVGTDFGVATPPDVTAVADGVHLAQLRRTDLAADGHVSTAKVFELFQEARILHFSALRGTGMAGNFVVANLAVDFVQPVAWRTEPLTIESWIARVGNSSLRIGSRIVDDGAVLATCDSVLVGFDTDTQKSRRFSEVERAALATTLRTP